MNLIVAKAYKMLHYVMRNLKGSSRKAKEKGYLSLVRPIVEYATTVWDPYHCGQIKKIEKLLDMLWENLEKRTAFQQC